jgi:hypothetical protein
MTPEDTPYHRTYSRVLVAFALLSVPVFLLLPYTTLDDISSIELPVALFGLSIASIWCPVLIYAGVRTRCTIDILVGCIGVATLMFWVPTFLLR